MMRRSGKWYRKNEREVMEQLGFRPTKNSGSGWIEKEDGINDDMLCQLKSTDANSIKINKYDLDTLNYNAMVAHKLPVFAIQFIQSNEIYLMVTPNQLQEIAEYMKSGTVPEQEDDFLDMLEDVKPTAPKRMIKSSSNAREKYMKEQNEKYRRKEKKAKWVKS